jgi:hypothetical protein
VPSPTVQPYQELNVAIESIGWRQSKFPNTVQHFLKVTEISCAGILRLSSFQSSNLGRNPLTHKINIGNAMSDSLGHSGPSPNVHLGTNLDPDQALS